jgi:FixJ family two-component response regulator
MAKSTLASVVYIVDADESVRHSLSRLMGSADLLPRTCDTLEAFVRETPGADVACALLDVSGLFNCDPGLWKQLQSRAARMPFIAISARDDPTTRRIARALGAQAFFRKPVDGAALLDAIDWAMRAEQRDGAG